MTRSGGCQCGAVRFRVEGELGRASICHCRMCQKAFGNLFGPYVSVHERQATWTRGAPKYFQSSNRVKRGFCEACGTQLTFEGDWASIDFAIGAFDDPSDIRPTSQIGLAGKIAWTDEVCRLPERSAEGQAKMAEYMAGIVSHQHPDHDT